MGKASIKKPSTDLITFSGTVNVCFKSSEWEPKDKVYRAKAAADSMECLTMSIFVTSLSFLISKLFLCRDQFTQSPTPITNPAVQNVMIVKSIDGLGKQLN